MSDAPPTDEFPAPPRQLTRAARRQAWREVAVRRWALATLGVAIVIAAVGVRAIRAGLDERELRRAGARLDARVELLPGTGRDADRSVARDIQLSVTLPGQSEAISLRGTTSPTPGRIAVGQVIPVFVDVANPNRWTDRVEPRGWASQLAAPLLLAPAVALLALAAIGRRGQVLRAWRDGRAARGQVLDAQTSAMVPGQKLLRVSVEGAARPIVVTYPDRLGARARGDAVDVVVAPGGARGVAAAAFAS